MINVLAPQMVAQMRRVAKSIRLHMVVLGTPTDGYTDEEILNASVSLHAAAHAMGVSISEATEAVVKLGLVLLPSSEAEADMKRLQ
jgi:hypothetical protein